MKIIDFERKGNVVRFYLGYDEQTKWGGDDWNDYPYECNAGRVYDEYVHGRVDVVFDFECLVLEPADRWSSNDEWSKNDMVARKVPCIIVVPPELVDGYDNFSHYVGMKGVKKFYFGDPAPETGTVPHDLSETDEAGFTVERYICEECGADLDSDFKYCPICGKKILWRGRET